MVTTSLLGIIPDPAHLLHGFGPWVLGGLALVIFIESGVLFPFLPGDSLLVTAAILRLELGINAVELITVASIAAILGDQVGYLLGRHWGVRLFSDHGRILRTDRLESARQFFARYGPLSLILGRFVPIIRTYVPLAAGTAGMKYSSFLRFNVLGAVGWVISMALVGLLLGHIPGIAHSIDVIMIVIIAVSLAPIVVAAARKAMVGKKQAVRSAETREPCDTSASV